MRIFEHDDYKIWLLKSLNEASQTKRGQQSALAEAMQCRPSYLSRVLSDEKTHLSLEQAESVSRFFTLDHLERAYLIALVGEKRAANDELKKYWQEAIVGTRNEYLQLAHRVKLESHLSSEQMQVYYSSWHYIAIHMGVTVPTLQTIDELANYFQIAKVRVIECLHFLSAVGLVNKDDGKYTIGKKQLHLDKNSTLIALHHTSLKLRSMEMVRNVKKNNLHYSSVVSISKRDFDNIRDILLSAIEATRKTVEKSSEEMVACYALEIFEMGQGD
jgi:uncharacterized protein (TIGR02147 family)